MSTIKRRSSGQRFVKTNRLGSGAFGTVYRAIDTKTNEAVALKKVLLSRAETNEGWMPKSFYREVTLMKRLRHVNITALKGVVVMKEKAYIVLEYLKRDLRHYIRNYALNPGLIKSYLKQLLSAVDFCHSRRVIHRDLKPSNLLIDGNGVIKVADFGLSRTFGPVRKRAYTLDVVTLWYRAPELLLGTREYTTAVDMWSVGVIFAEMLLQRIELLWTGSGNFDQLIQIFHVLGTPHEGVWPGVSRLPYFLPAFPKFTQNRLRAVFAGVDEVAVDLLSKLLVYDPAHRLSAADALKHPYFDDLPELRRRQAQACAVGKENHAPQDPNVGSSSMMHRMGCGRSLATGLPRSSSARNRADGEYKGRQRRNLRGDSGVSEMVGVNVKQSQPQPEALLPQPQTQRQTRSQSGGQSSQTPQQPASQPQQQQQQPTARISGRKRASRRTSARVSKRRMSGK